jgi:DNA-binding transcriptional LysR family regulator
MMHGKIDLNLFIVLRAVYEQGSITKAAQRLHLTQPAVSHALGRLRDNFNDDLFVRRGRQVVPTPFCQSIIASVTQAVDMLESTVRENVEFDISAMQRQVNLGLRDILESVLFPTLLPDLLSTTPNITINSRQVTWPEIVPSLANKSIDLVIDVLMPISSDIRSQFFCHDYFVVACKPDNPYLLERSVQAYANAQHALVTLKDSKLDTVDLALAQHNLHRDIVLQCEHYFAASNVVSQCNVLLTMPSQFAKALGEKFGLSITPLPFSVPPLPVHMYWHKHADDDLVNKWMRSKLMSVAKALGLGELK